MPPLSRGGFLFTISTIFDYSFFFIVYLLMVIPCFLLSRGLLFYNCLKNIFKIDLVNWKLFVYFVLSKCNQHGKN